jgi:aspartate/methionine/tyrosine aminotransferase
MAEQGLQENFHASARSKTIEYAIRDLVVQAKKVGKDVLYLNIGDPVKFGFDTPQHVKDALIRAVESNQNFYGDSEGLSELREAIAQREHKVNSVSIEKEDVVVTNGVSEGISMLMGSLIETGDEVLVPGPSYAPYISYIKFFGGVPIEYRTDEATGWQPDARDIRSKISKRTKAILVINPNNPTGALYGDSVLREIVSIALENHLLIISDEIYDELIFEKRGRSISSYSEAPIVGLNGFSKSSLMTGWRLGYLYFSARDASLNELKETIVKQARIRLCANTPVQMAALAALQGPRDYVTKMVQELKKRRDYSLNRINEIRGLSSAKPAGAFYLFPRVNNMDRIWKDDTQFVLDVLRTEKVLLVPGSGFGNAYGSGHFRVVFLPSVETLQTAYDRLDHFMSNVKAR